MKKYTITQFRDKFPNEDACLDHLFYTRFGRMKECPDCKAKPEFKRVKDRCSYQCSKCSYQIYPMAGTIFEKSTTPLLSWFWAIYMFTTTRNGVSAKELERQLSVCYKTALRMAHQIKKLISISQPELVMTGIVEADETIIGGKMANKHEKEKMKKYKTGNENKTIVLGLLERHGNVVTEVINNADSGTIKQIIRERVASGATLLTDSHQAYKGIKKDGIHHHVVNHLKGEYSRGLIHTNSLEGYWSMVKRTISGTHIHVSQKHLPKYLGEIAFRYNMRNKQDIMFETILSKV